MDDRRSHDGSLLGADTKGSQVSNGILASLSSSRRKTDPPVAVSVVPEGIIGEFLAAGRTLTLVP